MIQAMGLDIDQLDPHYFKSIPGYYAVCNLYDMMVDYRHVRQADGGGLDHLHPRGEKIDEALVGRQIEDSGKPAEIGQHVRGHPAKRRLPRGSVSHGFASVKTLLAILRWAKASEAAFGSKGRPGRP